MKKVEVQKEVFCYYKPQIIMLHRILMYRLLKYRSTLNFQI
jgi:hypothetical protein